jgi:glycosyltransferase involved in cell wall biosynthesis
MKLSVVIPCYNGADLLANQLRALANQSYSGPWELIVADNGSTDQSPSIVREFARNMDNLRLVDASGRRSAAHARNVGVTAASGDGILFLDHDDEAAPGYLSAMSAALSEHDFVAARVETKKLNPAWVQKSRGPQPEGLRAYRNPPFLPHAGGCALGFKRYVYDMVGGLDERFTTCEDTDFCFRVQLKGVALHFVPEAVVHYRYRHTLRDLFRQAIAYSEGNVEIYKEYRPRGMPETHLRQGLHRWNILIQSSLEVRDQSDLARWLWEFGWRVGRVKGSLKYKVVAL